jgi:plasmid stabilization system protein ParE
MRYVLSTLRRAENDVEHIYGWLARHSSAGAVAWYRAYVDAIGDLRQNPLAFGFAAERSLARREIRQRNFRTSQGAYYRILFTVAEDQIRVLRVRGPGQPPLRRI